MSRLVLPLLVILLSLASASATAQVYKCKRGTGYSYQDSPCPGRMVKRIEVPTVPPAPAAPRAPTPPAAATSAVPSAPSMVAVAAPAPTSSLAPVAPSASSAPVTPPPKAEGWQCTRHDGSRYFSIGRLPRGQQVPAALAPAGTTPGADGTVFVPDQCSPANREALCAWYAQQATANQQLQASARGMDLRRAQREGQRLKTLRSHRCGGA